MTEWKRRCIGIGRHVPESVARALLPSAVLGYVVPMLLMFISAIPHALNVAIMWQFAAISIIVLIFALSKSSIPR